MDTSERIAQALAEMFRCWDCDRWLPAAQAAYDVRDEDLNRQVCDDCADEKEVA